MRSALCVKKISKSEHTACILSYFVEIVHSIFYFLNKIFIRSLFYIPVSFAEFLLQPARALQLTVQNLPLLLRLSHVLFPPDLNRQGFFATTSPRFL